jgi:cobaltochelatase CobN
VLGFNFNFAAPDSSSYLAKVDVPVINLISLYGRTEQEWRASPQGLSMFEGTFNVATPELAGTIAPTVVGSQEKIKDPETGLTIVVRKPMLSQVALAVRRANEYAALRNKANRDKRVAIVFYNYPAGKANIGASYLNVAESIGNVLRRLKQEGYDVGTADLSGDNILKTLVEKSRNVGGYAPGELDALVAQGSAVRVGIAEYRRWLDALSPILKAKVIKDWGEPGKSRLMTTGGSLIVPAVQFGNIALLPQPARGWGEDAEKMYHARISRRITSTSRRMPGCVKASRPTPSSTSARTARSSGSTARTWACHPTMHRTG